MPLSTMYAPVNRVCLWHKSAMVTNVSSPRYRPNSYATDPAAFGRSEVEWLRLDPDASEDQKDQLGASKRQHAIAKAIRAAARRKHASVREHAEHNRINYQRLTGVLRGDLILRLEDIANAERTLDLTFEQGAQPQP